MMTYRKMALKDIANNLFAIILLLSLFVFIIVHRTIAKSVIYGTGVHQPKRNKNGERFATGTTPSEIGTIVYILLSSNSKAAKLTDVTVVAVKCRQLGKV